MILYAHQRKTHPTDLFPDISCVLTKSIAASFKLYFLDALAHLCGCLSLSLALPGVPGAVVQP